MSKITTAECKKILCNAYPGYDKKFWKRKKKHKLPSGQTERIFFGHTGKDGEGQGILISIVTSEGDKHFMWACEVDNVKLLYVFDGNVMMVVPESCWKKKKYLNDSTDVTQGRDSKAIKQLGLSESAESMWAISPNTEKRKEQIRRIMNAYGHEESQEMKERFNISDDDDEDEDY